MTIRLPEELEHYLHSKVLNGQFATEEAAVAEAVRRFRQWELDQASPQQAEPPTPAQEASAPAAKPIWEVFQEISTSVPDEVWDRMPADGAEQHNHYIHGTPKRPPAP